MSLLLAVPCAAAGDGRAGAREGGLDAAAADKAAFRRAIGPATAMPLCEDVKDVQTSVSAWDEKGGAGASVGGEMGGSSRSREKPRQLHLNVLGDRPSF
jgi:hypothetical protein